MGESSCAGGHLNLERLAKEMTSEAERNSAEVSELKKRVFQAMLNVKRSSHKERTLVMDKRKDVEVMELKERVFRAMLSMKKASQIEKTTPELPNLQKEDEMKALQLKNLMKRAFKGMRESKSSREGIEEDSLDRSFDLDNPDNGEAGPSELEHIADQLVEQLRTKADSIKMKIRKGLLRAHRNGELVELKEELAELADTVSNMGDKLSPQTSSMLSPPGVLDILPRRRWADASSGSESDFDPKATLCTRKNPNPDQSCQKDAITQDGPSDTESDGDARGRGRRWGRAHEHAPDLSRPLAVRELFALDRFPCALVQDSKIEDVD